MADPWYAFYPRDYRDKTSGLTMLQDCAYRRLIDEYYLTGEPLPANAEVLLRICRAFADEEKAAVTFVLHKFFVEGDDGWHHLRIDEELIKRAHIREKRVSAGKIGANATNGKQPGKLPAKKRQMPTQPQPHNISSVPSDIAALPEWVSKEAWDGYVEMRRRIRAPMTERAKTLALRELEALRAKGHDPTAIIDTATLKSWKSFYPPKADNENGAKSSERRATATDQHLAGIVALASDLRRERT